MMSSYANIVADFEAFIGNEKFTITNFYSTVTDFAKLRG